MSLASQPGEGGSSSRSRSFFRRTEKGRLEPAPGLALGKVVGDFQLVAWIGQGGMGQVWEAEQLSLRRRVAIKFVRPERVTERQLELFAREARAGGRLQHPGIVTVYGHGTSDGLAWIAMEFVEGAWTLKDFLDDITRTGELPRDYDQQVARFVAEVADALQAAHSVGVIHRDVKPHNVLITSGDHPKLTDFGLARITDETALSDTGDMAGSYYYMSPEQVTARRMGIDHRTDIFSLGVVLYELLALQRPFQGDTEHQVAQQIVTKDPPDPRAFRSRVPRDLAVIVGKALEKDRDKRFQSASELAADLRRFLAREPIRAHAPTPLDRAVKWVRRHPTRSIVGTVTITAFLVISGLLLETRRARDELEVSNRALSLKTAESEARRAEAERSKELADAERARADREADEVTRRAAEVLRLSALQTLDDLVAEADQLWPAHPEMLPTYEDWLRGARALCDELPGHRERLAELRRRAEPASEAPIDASSDAPHGTGSGAWRFADAKDRWWHTQLERLVTGLEALSAPDTGLMAGSSIGPHGWSVARRAEFARSIAERSVSGADGWAEAIAEIADAARSPQYGGLRIRHQIGLLPLGPDPRSGLWEFAHLQTGEPAVRDASGGLMLEEGTGIVFVLVPGGRFLMGAQVDENRPNYFRMAESDEGPVNEVSVEAFFLSKYEMTQSQWLLFTGENPSLYSPSTYLPAWNRTGTAGDLLHPVERVSWTEATRVVARLGLELPTEAQWEYACRAGTTSAWWCGDDDSLIVEVGNVADRYAQENGATSWTAWEDWDDGQTSHARVGSYEPNAFGLHDTIGNVCEWCSDRYEPGSDERVPRGGGFGYAATTARSSSRDPASPADADGGIGLRPARRLDP